MNRQERNQIQALLNHINPSMLDYQEWVNVGMVLKDNGFTAAEWDAWSRMDQDRYISGECFKKWQSFHGGNGSQVTVATLAKFAMDQGYQHQKFEHHELDWNDEIGPRDGMRIVDDVWVEDSELPTVSDWNPVADLRLYLSTLFQADDYVGYVTRSWKNEAGKHLPQKGCFDRTAGQLLQELGTCKSDVGSVIGDYDPAVGAWVRFNPLDGKGCKDENVTEFRYALIESDSLDIDRQYTLIKELELPTAILVHSGGKSLHAIVRVEADNITDYRKRVNYLYEVCQKNGLKLDRQNRNPSRLSRLPGVTRNGNKQYVVAVNIGKKSWQEWQEWVEDINDDLPDPECLKTVWGNLPDLAPPLIEGVLRCGHKLLIAGPSKAGKSYLVMQLCIAIAEGCKWLQWQCRQGRVLYVNLELDRASCLHRFEDQYKALSLTPKSIENIDIWNLRGSAVPMDKLAPKLIRRSLRRKYSAIVIDPIYKVLTGDENSAAEMANFCNQFDRICKELDAATIYLHHHSKGSQGAKFSRDRASGSGVFARDPDTMIDIIELNIEESRRKQIENKAVCEEITRFCEHYLNPGWDESISQDDRLNERDYMPKASALLGDRYKTEFPTAVYQVRQRIKNLTGWRVEGTLREFPRFDPVNIWYDFPIHKMDKDELLKDAKASGEEPPWMEKKKDRQSAIKEKKEDLRGSVINAFEAVCEDGKTTILELAEYMGVTEKSVRRRLKGCPELKVRFSEVTAS